MRRGRGAGAAASRVVATALCALLLAPSLLAADVRTVKEPAAIEKVWPAAAKVRVVNLWATWCGPCVAEMPDLRTIDETFGAEVALLGVSLDDMIPDTKPAKVTAFLEKYRIAFPNLYYTGNADTLGDYYGFNGELPVTIVFDRKGKELWRHEGRLDKNATIARLREILRRKP